MAWREPVIGATDVKVTWDASNSEVKLLQVLCYPWRMFRFPAERSPRCVGLAVFAGREGGEAVTGRSAELAGASFSMPTARCCSDQRLGHSERQSVGVMSGP